MAISFPVSPNTNDTHTVGSRIWTWAGTEWILTGGVVTASQIADGAITAAKIADGTIVAAEIANNAITTAKILDENVTTGKLANTAVTTAKISTDAVTTVKIQDLAVTGVKQANFAVSTKVASYTLVAADRHTRIAMNSASATTITVNTSLFSAGDIVELLNISSGVCTVTAGTATVSSAGALAIPANGGGTLYFTSAGVSIFFPSAVTTGQQIVQAVKSGTSSSSSTTYADISGMSVSITPTKTTSKVLILVALACRKSSENSTNSLGIKIVRDSTTINEMLRILDTNSLLENFGLVPLIFVDSPATISATTYKLQFKNLFAGDRVQINDASSQSTILALEILA